MDIIYCLVYLKILVLTIEGTNGLQGIGTCKKENSPQTGEHAHFCCEGFIEKNGKCVACSERNQCPKRQDCPKNYCGNGCTDMCECSVRTGCDKIYCCVCPSGSHGLYCNESSANKKNEWTDSAMIFLAVVSGLTVMGQVLAISIGLWKPGNTDKKPTKCFKILKCELNRIDTSKRKV